MEYIELNGGACDDCTIAIANDDYTGMSDEVATIVRNAIDHLCGITGASLVIGEERGFEHNDCAVCGAYPGNRHQVGYLAAVRYRVTTIQDLRGRKAISLEAPERTFASINELATWMETNHPDHFYGTDYA